MENATLRMGYFPQGPENCHLMAVIAEGKKKKA